MGSKRRERKTVRLEGMADVPELNVALFAWLLSYPWEFWQVPFYQGIPTVPHWEAIKSCTGAVLGDAAIAVGAFWVAAVVARSRGWILRPTRRDLSVFVLAGVATTAVLEWHATRVAGRWAYAASMPMVPGVGIGLLPVLQWIVVPLVVVWFVRRQLT
jgi:hypothetical protein